MIDAYGAVVSEEMKPIFGGPAPTLWDFWLRVFGLFTLFHVPILKDAIAPCPILGLISYQQELVTFLFIAAKHAIARAWKRPATLFAEVKSILTILMINEKMTSILRDTHAKVLKVWALWWSYDLSTLHPTSLGLSN